MDSHQHDRLRRSDPEQGRAETLAARARAGLLDPKKLRAAARLGHAEARAITGDPDADLRRLILAREEEAEDLLDEPLSLLGDAGCWGLCRGVIERLRSDFTAAFRDDDPGGAWTIASLEEAVELLSREYQGQSDREQRAAAAERVDHLANHGAESELGYRFGLTVRGVLYAESGKDAALSLIEGIPRFTKSDGQARLYLDACLAWIAARLLA